MIAPVVAFGGTVVEIEVPPLTAKVALAPLNLTDVAPVRFVPSIFTEVPTPPEPGPKSVIVGAGGGGTAKIAELVAVPAGVVTAIVPLVAPAGTVVEIEVSPLPVKVALVPLNLTAVAPLRFVPVIVTPVPAGPPAVGVKPEMVGAGAGMR